LAGSQRPFERWLRWQLQVLLGWNVQEVLLFDWPDERYGLGATEANTD
jgi:hypothetical protein